MKQLWLALYLRFGVYGDHILLSVFHFEVLDVVFSASHVNPPLPRFLFAPRPNPPRPAILA